MPTPSLPHVLKQTLPDHQKTGGGGTTRRAGNESNDRTGIRARLAAVGDDELCCGTFWLAEDFLGINPAMTPDEIAAAMEYAEDHHDANEGFNWWHLEMAIDAVLLEKGGA